MSKHKPEPVYTCITDTLKERGAWVVLLRAGAAIRSHEHGFQWPFEVIDMSLSTLLDLCLRTKPSAGRKWFANPAFFATARNAGRWFA